MTNDECKHLRLLAGLSDEEHHEREQLLRDALDFERKRLVQLDDRWKAQHREAMRHDLTTGHASVNVRAHLGTG